MRYKLTYGTSLHIIKSCLQACMGHKVQSQFYAEVSLSPNIPIKIKPRKTIRCMLSGSLKRKIPNITVPKAPIPVHTAYAVPIGSDFVASDKR